MCHCTSPKDSKSKKKSAKTYWRHVAHSAVCINFSIFGMTVSTVPVTLALLPRKQYGLHEKLLDSSAFQVQCTHWQTLNLRHCSVAAGAGGTATIQEGEGVISVSGYSLSSTRQTKAWNWGFSAASEGEEAISTSRWEGQTEGVLWWRWCWGMLPVVG